MKNEYQILFFTHTGAIKFQRLLQQKKIPCELMPVPRVLSSNCGVSARIAFEGEITELIDKEVEKVFRRQGEEYTLIYQAED